MKEIDDSPLGKQTDYADSYNPKLLHPIPREPKRKELGVETSLPFHGVDVWNCYEFSWLNTKGLPQVAVVEFSIPADSANIIESKSFKLYLNSFNQSPMSSAEAVVSLLTKDLSQAAGKPVAVTMKSLEQREQLHTREAPSELIDDQDIEVTEYQLSSDLLSTSANAVVEETLCSHLLKSNCPVTGQPDWATVYVRYRGAPIDREGLLRYVISYRQHQEFHEQCVERFFLDLAARCQPEKLTVWARYTRRGGLDINPYRSNDPDFEAGNLRHLRQ